jgi:formylglycine-generating enzyme required for sulfatase activity
MKKIVVILVAGLAISSQTFSQTIPARTVLIDQESSFYMDANEVTVGDYLAFLNVIKEVKGENSAVYKEVLPNDAMCQQAYKTANYFTDPAYLNYPMVGITYEQALVYCGWRTDEAFKTLNNLKKKPTYMYSYSLPTDVELQKAYALQTEKPATKTIAAVNLKTKGITDLGYNVKEMTANKKVLVEEGANGLRFENYTGEASPMLGFRCKLVIKVIN